MSSKDKNKTQPSPNRRPKRNVGKEDEDDKPVYKVSKLNTESELDNDDDFHSTKSGDGSDDEYVNESGSDSEDEDDEEEGETKPKYKVSSSSNTQIKKKLPLKGLIITLFPVVFY